MRRGELLALEWRDIDLDRGVLRVERAVEETKAGLRIKPPKTKMGRRNIGLAPDAVAMLREIGSGRLSFAFNSGKAGNRLSYSRP